MHKLAVQGKPGYIVMLPIRHVWKIKRKLEAMINKQ